MWRRRSFALPFLVLVALVAVSAVLLLRDDADVPARGADDASTAATARALPERAIAYTVGVQPQTIAVFDADAGVEYQRFAAPEGVHQYQLTARGELLYFRRVGEPTSSIREGGRYELTMLDVLSGERRILASIERYVDFGFAVSPDGQRVAYSTADDAPGADGFPADALVHVMEIATGDDRVVGRFAYQSDDFSGAATVRTWRDDGEALFIVGAKQSGAAPGLALLRLDDGVIIYNEPAFGRTPEFGRWLVYQDINSVGSVFHSPQRIRIIDPETNVELNRMEDPDQCMSAQEWAPDGSALVVTEYERLVDPEDAFPCDISRAWHWLLSADGSAPEEIDDLSGLRRDWVGDRLVEFACPDGYVSVSSISCGGERVDLRVNGQVIATDYELRVLGWIER